MRESLLAWFEANGRDLPWRRTHDPYAILVSEVMLQQTQVDRVVPRYLAWLERWPTVDALAAAPAADVIREWQGLGYYRRALNLHRAAGQIAAGGWPDDLTELPGVGRYTADAVARFAFGRDVLPVDTNVARVRERTGEAFDARCSQALMDLGATVCIARVPRCGVCPLASDCPSRDRRYEPLRKQGRFEGSFRQRPRGRCASLLSRRDQSPISTPTLWPRWSATVSSRSRPGSSACRLDEGDGLSGESLAAAGKAELVGRRRADVDPLCVCSDRFRQALAHLLPKRRDPWLLADQDAVCVDELPPGLVYLRGGAPQQIERRCALPLRLPRWKQRTDVAQPRSAEQCIDQGMGDHVAVGMAREAPRRLDRDPAEHERNAVRERVRIDPQPDPQLAHPSGSCRRSRRLKTVTVS